MERIKSILIFGGSLLILTSLVYGGVNFIQQQTDTIFLSSQFFFITVFLFFVTLFAYGISTLGIAGDPEVGVYGILGGIIVKMIVSLSFFIFLLYRFPEENQTILALNFFCVYLLLTVFEVIVLLRNLRRKIK